MEIKYAALILLATVAIAVSAWVLWPRRDPPVVKNTNTSPESRDARRQQRLSYEESCKALQHVGYLKEGAIPPVPDHRPRYDDNEPLGLQFFRTRVKDDGLDNMTLRRTFFGKSEVGPASFKNTDLSESTFCWNDFNNVDFTDADLSKSDLRGSLFHEVIFVRADLHDSDLRQSRFEKCDFANATMQRAKLTREQGKTIALSANQRQEIDWQDSDGEPPGGG
jgi:uncharacterized protein YjbI with pentapeptide repeats